MKSHHALRTQISQSSATWLITGVAGFIGSNLLETLLELDQYVVGLDNFSTGHQHNLDEVRRFVSSEQWERFRFENGDIRDLGTCRRMLRGVDHVLHQAALGSVPRSINDPISSNESNVSGFLNVLVAARDQNVSSLTYAASSSTYGDHPGLPKVEGKIGMPLSPYAVTKYVNELYASVFARTYGLKTIGLRYFNVFGPRQDPEGSYAAVIPKWINTMLAGESVVINGDGETSRDFCYVDNAVQANLLAAVAPDEAKDEVYNVAVGERTSLNELYEMIEEMLALRDLSSGKDSSKCQREYHDFRAGDVRHSLADISKIQDMLGYRSVANVRQGIEKTLNWFSLQRNAEDRRLSDHRVAEPR